MTPQIQSIWISSLAPKFNYSISWKSSTNNSSHIINLNSLSNVSAAVIAIYAGSVTSVKRLILSMSPWIEYRLTFDQTASSLFSSFTAVAALSSNDRFIYTNTFLDNQNYPLFYDFSHPRGYGGSGR